MPFKGAASSDALADRRVVSPRKRCGDAANTLRGPGGGAAQPLGKRCEEVRHVVLLGWPFVS